MSASEAELDPSVCYRHPDRTSWVLCTRCGKTICPECQILTPSGVQCPDCVRETGGSVRWEPTNSRPVQQKVRTRRARTERVAAEGGQSQWRTVVGQMVRPGGEAPVVTWTIISAVAVLWVVGLLTSNLSFFFLAEIPGLELQVWRFFTSAFAYPAVLDFQVIFSLVLGLLCFGLSAPYLESQLSRPRFVTLFFASGAFGAAAMALANSASLGLLGALFGIVGAQLVLVWPHPPSRTRALIFLGFFLLIFIVASPGSLPLAIGGLLAGVLAMLAFRRYDERPRSRPSTPYLLIFGGVAVLIALAVIRSLLR